jgi:hypothetical protein
VGISWRSENQIKNLCSLSDRSDHVLLGLLSCAYVRLLYKLPTGEVMNHTIRVADVRQLWLDGARPVEDTLQWCVRHAGTGRWYWSLCAEVRHYACEGLF